ncbi:MAG TPA: hypothetical protein VFB31_01610 [Pseudolabrys sp.]|nr:hypothetical protein [Pseudolabrys sp.]
MKKISAAAIGAGLAFAAAWLVAALPAEALGIVRAHPRLHHHGFAHRLVAPFPYGDYGGYIATAPYGDQPAVTYVAAPEPIIVQPPRVLSCQRSEQVVTVPAEAGGTRDIRVTRC